MSLLQRTRVAWFDLLTTGSDPAYVSVTYAKGTVGPTDLAGDQDVPYNADVIVRYNRSMDFSTFDPASTVLLHASTTHGTAQITTAAGNCVLQAPADSLFIPVAAPSGDISNRRLLIAFDEEGLDGMRCDVAGNLYVARWGAGVVLKLSPAGEILQEVKLHGKNCTNLTFGGPDGRTCYVTVADTGQVERFHADLPGRLTPPY